MTVLLRFGPAAASAFALAVVCSSSAIGHATDSPAESLPGDHSPRHLPRGAQPMRDELPAAAAAKPAIASAPDQQLLYFGGNVIGNARIVAVNWGPAVSTAISGQIGAFYTAVTNSAYFDWLSEYETTGVRAQDGSLGTSQRIGRGSFVGSFTITPSTTSNHISDEDISRELVAQIFAGNLPAPETDAAGNVNSLYMFDFPSSVVISLWNAGGTAFSCTGGFGAYHSTVRYGALSVPYGVHPDCKKSFASVTSVHAHEMIEAVTDPSIGLVDPDFHPGETRPSAWYSFLNGADNGEIADLCENSPGGTIGSFSVASLWSNSQGACIVTAPTIICDGATTPVAGCRACTAADDGVACNGPRAHCETDSSNAKFGQCVVCTQDAQCPSAQPTCKKGSDPTDDTCVSTAACSTNAQCSGATPICDATTHACRACLNVDCTGATPACEKLSGNIDFGRCVVCTEANTKACGGATPICDTFTNKCVTCMQNFDCPAATPVCGFPSHQCQACATNDDCLDRGGVCATSASDPNKGRCVQCLASTDCISPATCTNDVCSGGSGLDDGGTNVPWDSGDPVVTAGSDAGGGGGDGGSAGDDGGTVVGNDAGAGNDGGGTVVPPGGGPDGGGPGAVDAGEGGGGSAGGCHCSAGRSGPSSEGIASALLLGVVGLVRRRRWKAQAR